MEKEIVVEVPGNVLDMMVDLEHKLQQRVITPQQFRKFLKKENPFVGLDFSLILRDWEKYYREIHALKIDFSGVRIPEASDEFSWLICRPENFFAERAFSGGKILYPKFKWTNKLLGDGFLDMSFGRDGETEPYIARVRPNWEADEDLENLLANQIAERNINTLCLTERLLLGDFLYWKYQKHLDMQVWTLCAGSRCFDGDVLGVSWREFFGGVFVDCWYDSDGVSDVLRSRQVVS